MRKSRRSKTPAVQVGPRELRPSEVIERLDKMAIRWPSGYVLYAQNGSMLMVRLEDGFVAGESRVPCDGGDARLEYQGDKEYLCL